MCDTPLSRRLVNLVFQLTHSRATRHHFTTWPGLHIARKGAAVTIRYRGQPIGAEMLTGLPSGLAEITVIGSGPSLKGQAVGRLPQGSAILLNGTLALVDQIQPLAIAIEDERFVWRHPALIDAAPKDCIWMLSSSVIRALLQRDTTALKHRRLILIEDLLKPAGGTRRSLKSPEIQPILRRNAKGARLSLRPNLGCIPAGTIAYPVLQFALAARPALLGLAGIDLGNAHSPRFNETPGHTAFSGIVNALDRILPAFDLGRLVVTQAGIALACYSPVSELLKIDYPYSARLDPAADLSEGA